MSSASSAPPTERRAERLDAPTRAGRRTDEVTFGSVVHVKPPDGATGHLDMFGSMADPGWITYACPASFAVEVSEGGGSCAVSVPGTAR